MELPSNVKAKTGLWKFLPLSKTTAQAIFPNIYLPQAVYNNLKSVNPTAKNVAVLEHELTHLESQKRVGPTKWFLKYLVSPGFRFDEELQAIKASMKYLKRQKESFDTQKIAKYLSSWLYLWCVFCQRAKKELTKAWKEG